MKHSHAHTTHRPFTNLHATSHSECVDIIIIVFNFKMNKKIKRLTGDMRIT